MNPTARAIQVVVLAILLWNAGCSGDTPVSGLPTTTMRIGSADFSLEIATSDHDQEVGLMHRDHMDQDHGMIFVFPDELERTFWNHNVHFPLDLLFLDASGVIVSMKHMEAYSDLNVGSGAPAKYVIELNAGVPEKQKLAVGMRLTIPKEAANPPPTTTPSTLPATRPRP